MPHHKSAVKRIHTSERDARRNASVRSELKTHIKRASQDPMDKELTRLASSRLDRAVRKGVIAKAVANRRKSRLQRMANRATRAS